MALYTEIADDLRARIAAGEWLSGDHIASMPQLMTHYGVPSPNTIRQAQKILISEGVLRSAQGVGVFVAAPHPDGLWHQTASVRDELLAIQQATTRALAQVPEQSTEAMHIVRRLTTAWDAFLDAARSEEGFREDLLEALVDALRDFAAAWQDTDTMPRVAVRVLVELVPLTQSAADGHEEPTRQELYNASFTLHELATACCTQDKSR